MLKSQLKVGVSVLSSLLILSFLLCSCAFFHKKPNYQVIDKRIFVVQEESKTIKFTSREVVLNNIYYPNDSMITISGEHFKELFKTAVDNLEKEGK